MTSRNFGHFLITLPHRQAFYYYCCHNILHPSSSMAVASFMDDPKVIVNYNFLFLCNYFFFAHSTSACDVSALAETTNQRLKIWRIKSFIWMAHNYLDGTQIRFKREIEVKVSLWGNHNTNWNKYSRRQIYFLKLYPSLKHSFIVFTKYMTPSL